MDEKGRKLRNVLRISVVLITILFGIFAEESWAQMPSIEFWNPGDNAINVLINTDIRIRFDMQMNPNPTNYQFELWDNTVDQEVPGTVQWTQSPVTGDNPTSFPNDTLIFIPTNALRPGRSYTYGGMASSLIGGGAWFEKNFITKHSTADTTPPIVQTTFPYSGMTGVSTGQSIFIRFSEVMNPSSITTAGNITLTGPCMGGMSDYSVNYDFEDSEIEIRKNSPFAALLTCNVTITTNVRDLRGNPLKDQYAWSFTTGAADGVPPTVTQTIPASGDIKVSLFPGLYAIFSEEMDETTLNGTNITLYDNTGLTWVPINIYWTGEDYVSFGPQSALTYNHNYTVTIGTGVKDLAGNNLTLKTWSFTAAADSGVDSDPSLNWGVGSDDHIGQRWLDGTTRVLFELGAWDQVTSSLTVTATTSGHTPWSLTNSPGDTDYLYESSGNEGLLYTGVPHLVTFTIQDGAGNTVSFQRNIYIFSTTPTLSLPINGATGVSTTPTFQWTYSAGDRPLYYSVVVFDGPDPNTANMIWIGVMVDTGSGTQFITIPADKKLMPNKTYYWAVRGANRNENGETYGGLWPFTTTGTAPPAPRFAWAFVRSDDRPAAPSPPMGLQWNLAVKVARPSPADIVELKVTGPGGFQYIFTEDDILQGEQNGLYFWKMMAGSLPNGQYTFTVIDSMGRTATSNYDFVNPSGTIPRVSSTSMVPGNNTYSVTATPTLQWGGVGPGYYYRVRVMDWTGRLDVVYQSPFIQDTQFTIPSGYLFPNTSYKWRVEVYEGPAPRYNRSVSETFAFSTGAQGLNLVWGMIWAQNDHYTGQRTSLNALVRGALPSEFTVGYPSTTFLKVTVNPTSPSFPSGGYFFTEPQVWYPFFLIGDIYSAGLPGFPPNGDYTFTAQVLGGSDTYTKTGQASNPINIVDQGSMLPVNNAYLTSFTPTFSWTAVAGSPRYYRITISSWKTNYYIYQSARTLNQSSFTIPAGILKANQSYKWRVQVFDDQDGEVADNSSSSGWNAFTIPIAEWEWSSIPGNTASPPSIAWNPVANEMLLLVRASDNSIWTSTFSGGGSFNNDWMSIPGMTISPMALAWNPVAQEMLVVVRAADDSIWVSTFHANGSFNNDWASIPGRTASPPAIAWNPSAGKMQMVVRAGDGSVWKASFSSANVFNNDWASIPGNTASPPAIAWNPSANEMQMVVRAWNNSMWVATFDATGNFNNDWAPIPGMTVEPPALAWDEVEAEVGMLVRAADDSMWLSSFDGTGAFLNNWASIPGRTASPPAMTWHYGVSYMQVVVRASDGSVWSMFY